MRQFGDQSITESRQDDFYLAQNESTDGERQDHLTVRLLVIIPCFNEQNTVVGLLTHVLATLPASQIIFLDDSSTDASLKLLMPVATDMCIEIPRATENQGKVATFRTVLE